MIQNLGPPVHYFVSFIDLLGFSNMVKSDLEAPNGSEKYLEKLYNVHKKTLELNETPLKLDLVQFSDSIVLASEFNKDNFPAFLDTISKYQYDLFCNGILSRGGIAYGKHFYNEGFMFSLGLIEAYKIESKVAKFPRIVVSNDLLNLVYPAGIAGLDLPLVKENDGLIFIDFLKGAIVTEAIPCLGTILINNKSSDSSVQEKHTWLKNYFNFKFPEAAFPSERFEVY